MPGKTCIRKKLKSSNIIIPNERKQLQKKNCFIFQCEFIKTLSGFRIKAMFTKITRKSRNYREIGFIWLFVGHNARIYVPISWKMFTIYNTMLIKKYMEKSRKTVRIRKIRVARLWKPALNLPPRHRVWTHPRRGTNRNAYRTKQFVFKMTYLQTVEDLFRCIHDNMVKSLNVFLFRPCFLLFVPWSVRMSKLPRSRRLLGHVMSSRPWFGDRTIISIILYCTRSTNNPLYTAGARLKTYVIYIRLVKS